MSTQGVTQDWGEVEISRSEQYRILDERARAIERDYKSTWLELADLCTTMRDSQLWQEGGFHSFNAWLLNACPTSRSFAYAAMGWKEELSDIPRQELEQIPPGNAETLTQTPKKKRKGEILRLAKAQTPQEFRRTVIEEAPEAHVEQRHCHKFRLTTSQGNILRGALTMWRVLNNDPDAEAETALEGVLADYMTQNLSQYKATQQKSSKAL